MRRSTGRLLAAALALFAGTGVRAADDDDAKVAQQKKSAAANWSQLEAGEPAHIETDHLLIYAPKALEKRIKDIGVSLESYYSLARKALQFNPKQEPWSGKLAVYLLGEREQFTAFIRRVEKRRLEPDESGSFNLSIDLPHVAAAPPRAKLDAKVETQAAEQIASALLARRAGSKVPLPTWVVAGFGRATSWRAASVAYAGERKSAANLVTKNRRGAKDVWGEGLEPEEATLLHASLMDYLAYGPGSTRFIAFLTGFQPEENVESKTTEQALMAANVKPEILDRAWKVWLRTAK